MFNEADLEAPPSTQKTRGYVGPKATVVENGTLTLYIRNTRNDNADSNTNINDNNNNNNNNNDN
jgi:hypothetical protein